MLMLELHAGKRRRREPKRRSMDVEREMTCRWQESQRETQRTETDGN